MGAVRRPTAHGRLRTRCTEGFARVDSLGALPEICCEIRERQAGQHGVVVHVDAQVHAPDRLTEEGTVQADVDVRCRMAPKEKRSSVDLDAFFRHRLVYKAGATVTPQAARTFVEQNALFQAWPVFPSPLPGRVGKVQASAVDDAVVAPWVVQFLSSPPSHRRAFESHWEGARLKEAADAGLRLSYRQTS